MSEEKRWEGRGPERAPSEENKAVVLKYYQEVLNRRREDLLPALLAPGFRSRFGSFEVDALGYQKAVHRSLEAFPDLKVEILAQVAEGDLVATRWQATGTLAGRTVTVPAMHFHRVEEGLLAEHWEELDPSRLR